MKRVSLMRQFAEDLTSFALLCSETFISGSIALIAEGYGAYRQWPVQVQQRGAKAAPQQLFEDFQSAAVLSLSFH